MCDNEGVEGGTLASHVLAAHYPRINGGLECVCEHRVAELLEYIRHFIEAHTQSSYTCNQCSAAFRTFMEGWQHGCGN